MPNRRPPVRTGYNSAPRALLGVDGECGVHDGPGAIEHVRPLVRTVVERDHRRAVPQRHLHRLDRRTVVDVQRREVGRSPCSPNPSGRPVRRRAVARRCIPARSTPDARRHVPGRGSDQAQRGALPDAAASARAACGLRPVPAWRAAAKPAPAYCKAMLAFTMPAFNQDELAEVLTLRRADWQQRGVELGELTWRTGDTVWPRTITTDRSEGADPKSVGLTLYVTDDDQAEVVFWRHGWADVSAIIGGNEFHDAPDLGDISACTAYVDQLIDRLTAGRPSPGRS